MSYHYKTRYKKRKFQDSDDVESDQESSDTETDTETEDSEFIEELEKELNPWSESSDETEDLDKIKEELEKELDDLEGKEEEEEEAEETKGEPVELGFIEIKPGDNWMETLAQKIMEQAQEQKERDSEYKKDDLNKQFIEACNSKHLQIETFEDDFVYFRKLNKQDKKKYINTIQALCHKEKDIPLRFRVLNSTMDSQTKSIVISHIDKLSQMEHANGEYHKMKNWIDGVLKIPFDHQIHLSVNETSPLSEKRTFLKRASDTLTQAIYGHDKAKSYILQVLCKWIQNPMSQGNILALQGPMGNGKTTLIKEGVAKALNRPFAFISLGGASDSSLFQGHSYTYEGSTWGKIVDVLMKTNCMNPIIYFDELDKISDTNKGDEIVHFLTHITDLSQNSVYQDNYFPGINIDLSKILFIFSFNDESKVNRILKDRMQVIHTKGFTNKEKVTICQDYLLPDVYKNYNVDPETITFTEEVIQHIIDNYTSKEAGVRNLKRCIDVIVSKINMYQIMFDPETEECSIELPYTLTDFKLPYTVCLSDIGNLLDQSTLDKSKPPEHMYV